MVKHIIIWKLKDSLSGDERAEYSKQIKNGLEGLKGRIDGLADIHVVTDMLTSSNGDLLLDSTFETEQALKDYQTDPQHLKVAAVVRSVTVSRDCADFEI